jgi:histidinol-phosphate/aromatic aminotransferase/cobyric acid decarboxylase-like protein
VVVRTRARARVTRTDYLDVAGLLHGRSNGLVLFANPTKPVSRAVERSVIRAVARRLP